MVTGWLPEHAGAARLAARSHAARRRDEARDRRPRRARGRAGRARWSWCSSASSASPSRLRGRRPPTVAGRRAHRRGPGRGHLGHRARRRPHAAAGRRGVRAPRPAWPSALDVIPQGVVVFDDDGAIVYRNEVAAGLPRRPPRRGPGRGGDRRARRGGAAAGRPRGARRAPRPLRPAPPHPGPEAVAPRSEDGRRLGVLVVIDDVTERRRLEAVRRDFVANISHELKTPVGALGLLAETLLAEDDAVVAQRLAERMLTEAVPRRPHHRRPARALPHRGRRGGAARDVPVHRFIAEAVDRVRPAAEQQGIAIEVDEPAARLAVAGDRRQLVSAIYNLLENAVKYSDAGSTVQVRARTDGRWVDIEVQDHGIGIPGATSSGSSSASTGSTGPAAARPAARASASPSSATSPATTTARCRSSPPRARAPRSPCGCRSGPGPVAVTVGGRLSAR